MVIVLISLLTGRDDYLWASTIVSSRSFPSSLMMIEKENPTAPGLVPSAIFEDLLQKPLENDNSNPSEPILIPVMDMLNHRPLHPVLWLTSPHTINFVAETSYSAGIEIFNNYGPKGNEECTILHHLYHFGD